MGFPIILLLLAGGVLVYAILANNTDTKPKG